MKIRSPRWQVTTPSHLVDEINTVRTKGKGSYWKQRWGGGGGGIKMHPSYFVSVILRCYLGNWNVFP